MLCWILVGMWLSLSTAFVVLKDKEHIQLNDANGTKSINASTYNRLAFDERHNILYVTAKEPRRLTTFVLAADDQATLLREFVFSANVEGMPLDVELCQPSAAHGVPRLAVSFQNPIMKSAEGTVRIYQGLTPIDSQLRLMKEVTVGAEPVDMAFAQDCMVLLVANRGRPTKVTGNVWVDPEGTVSKITLPRDLDPDSPISTVTISFHDSFMGDFPNENIAELRAKNFRWAPIRDPSGVLLTIMQNIEPERIIVTPSGQTAYVSLPKNNAMARLRLEFNSVEKIFPLGNRSWTDYHLDPSDADNAVSLRGYNIYSLSQTTEMRWIKDKNGDEWMVTLDTGILNYLEDYRYADHDRAKSLVQKGDITTADSTLAAQLADDTELGRLFVSREDGRDQFTGKISDVFTFGGRGFSIRDGNVMETPTVIVDQVEEAAEEWFPNIFNSAYTNSTNTPQSDKEATSPALGPELTGLALGEFQGKTVLFLGGGSSGILYVYMLSPDSRCLQPYFHSVHRTGDTYTSWQAAYSHGKMGDIGITDMLYIHSENILPVVVVAAATSNSVSVYQVAEEPFLHPGK